MKIWCFSDIHGFHRQLTIPKDIDGVIFAGDCSNQRNSAIIDFSNFVAKFSALNPTFWQKVSSLVPADWQTTQLDEIRAHIETIVQNKDVFKTELNRILK